MSKNLSQQVVLDRRGLCRRHLRNRRRPLVLLAAPTPVPRPTRVPPLAPPRAPKILRLLPRSTPRRSTSSVDNGPKADDDAIAASTWATAVKDAGVFKIGGVQDLYALLPPQRERRSDPRLRRRYRTAPVQLHSEREQGRDHPGDLDTRESVLQNGQVDAVFATLHHH